mmetsp:Transcript_2906/g.6418  ORF Transcript_2906/g.6418 Transcript_2906/m.6418 type:complete len:200 (-) Transcript_2906:511-1110(-)
MRPELPILLSLRNDIYEGHCPSSYRHEVQSSFVLEHVPEHAKFLALLLQRSQVRLLAIPLHIEVESRCHHNKAHSCNRPRQVPVHEYNDGMCGANNELQNLHFSDSGLSNERHSSWIHHGQGIVQVHAYLAGATHSGWKVGIATAREATSKIPSPHVGQTQVGVQSQKGPTLELLPHDYEARVKELELPAVVVRPQEHA